MRVVLRQSFRLGRFHATKWGVNPYENRLLEWPPSPWRLVRAVTARWYQWWREAPEPPNPSQLDRLIRAFCTSTYEFHLTQYLGHGIPLRQYQPTEFGRQPASVKSKKGKVQPGRKAYRTSLVQDNYIVVPGNDHDAIWWFIDGENWSQELLDVLDRCLERMTYFGRAESISTIKRQETNLVPNCTLRPVVYSPHATSVLVPASAANRASIEGITGKPDVGRATPAGACYMYAEPPQGKSLLEAPHNPHLTHAPCAIQFAIGWNVGPTIASTVRLTARYRMAAVRELLLIKSGGRVSDWSKATAQQRASTALMIGKDPSGMPLVGHRHAEFFLWWEEEMATRLLVLREKPFNPDEETALLRASQRSFSWSGQAVADAWTVKLIPLPNATSLPPGFGPDSATCWESVTPYVPHRHHLRRGHIRNGESIKEQVIRNLDQRFGLHCQDVKILDTRWVTVHMPKQSAAERTFVGQRRGYLLRLNFSAPIKGPLRIGHSSSLGLGLFKPVA
jgi:CRISPR-associated protein Csb2